MSNRCTEATTGEKLNADRKRARRAAELSTFVQHYARKGSSHGEPNDRSHDRDVQARIRRMRPEELDRLLREDE